MGGPQKKWTEEDDNYIREHYPTDLTEEVAERLGRTFYGVQSRAHVLGVTKDTKRKVNKRKAKQNPQDRSLYREETECLADIICFLHRRKVKITEACRTVRCPQSQYEEILERCIKDGSYERYRNQENSHIIGRLSTIFDFAVRDSIRNAPDVTLEQFIVNE